MKKRIKRTEESAVQELLTHYEEYGKFNTTTLMAKNSGLERHLRVHHEGLRGFCERHGISHILLDAKVTQWDEQKVVSAIKDLHAKYNQPITYRFLLSKKQGKIYQWITKNGASYQEFCDEQGISEITNAYTQWSDAKVYRLVKEMFVENGGIIYPEMVKKKEKGAYNYVYTKHTGFDVFIDLFDLHEFIGISLDQLATSYTDENVVRLLKEAYILHGEPVTPTWLNSNGYGGVYSYIANKGAGTFKVGAELLGVSDCITIAHNRWTLSEVTTIVCDMHKEKQSPIMHKDFTEKGLFGVRSWIERRYGSLRNFFEEIGMADKFINMRDTGKDLWAHGMRFERLVKEVLEELHDDIIYDKWYEHLHARPDFIFGETGVWADAKLSSHAYFTSETVEKYTKFDDCKELQLIYLRGHEFKTDNPKVKLVSVDSYIPKLKLQGRQDLVDKIFEMREEVEKQEQETYERASSN